VNNQASKIISSENEIQDELKIQKELKNAQKSFQSKEIVAMGILKCEYVDKNTVLYDDKKYNISMCEELNAYANTGEKVYVPIFVLKYDSIYKTFTSGWYLRKNEANDKIRELENHTKSLRYKFSDSNSLIINKTRDIFEPIYLSNKLKLFSNLDTFLLLMLPYTLYMLIYILTTGISIINTEEYASIAIIYTFVFALIPVLIQFGVRYINNRFEDIYKPVKMDANEIIKSNLINQDSSYKVITVDINVTDEGINIYSDELDCNWFYKRDDNYTLPDCIIKLLNSVPVTDNSCVLSVKENGYTDSPWISECGEFWIDTDSFEN